VNERATLIWFTEVYVLVYVSTEAWVIISRKQVSLFIAVAWHAETCVVWRSPFYIMAYFVVFLDMFVYITNYYS